VTAVVLKYDNTYLEYLAVFLHQVNNSYHTKELVRCGNRARSAFDYLYGTIKLTSSENTLRLNIVPPLFKWSIISSKEN
jgi:hypothetical protein